MRPLVPRRLILVWVLATACDRAGAPRASPNDSLATSLARLLDSAVAANPHVPSLVLGVDAPVIGFEWRGAAGVLDRATGRKISAENTFRIASNTKTYVAAAILRLHETGRLGLDDPIAGHVAPTSTTLLERAGYDPETITIRHLLHHTSGLFDYANAPEYFRAVTADFAHRWTREEQLQYAMQYGKPYGKPGEVYHYSDTGYILLGEILERLTGLSLGQAVSSLLGFDRLGIRHTYFETIDSVPPGTPPRAHQYLDTLDLYEFNPSPDLYGGGGLVSNVDDLIRFYRSLVRGEVFENPETLALMLEPTPQSREVRPDGGYGMGIAAGEWGSAACYGHGGYLGTLARSCPAIDLTIACSMNRSPDSAGTVGRVMTAAASLVQRAIEEQGVSPGRSPSSK